MGFDKKTKRRPKNRQTKQNLVFDEKSRHEYLTGFRKRKNERRKYAQEKAERMLQEEKKELKRKRREFMERKTKHQYVPPDLAALAPPTVTELPEHTVTVTDISKVDLAGQGGLRLGINQFHDEENTVSEQTETGSNDENLSQKKKHKILKKMDQKIQQKSKHLKISKTSRKSFKKHSSKKQRHKKRNTPRTCCK